MGLKQNQIVLTGSPLPLYSVRPGDRIVVRCSRSGAVETTVGPSIQDFANLSTITNTLR
jgi:2-keto-4-pentenoate hydratase